MLPSSDKYAPQCPGQCDGPASWWTWQKGPRRCCHEVCLSGSKASERQSSFKSLVIIKIWDITSNSKYLISPSLGRYLREKPSKCSWDIALTQLGCTDRLTTWKCHSRRQLTAVLKTALTLEWMNVWWLKHCCSSQHSVTGTSASSVRGYTSIFLIQTSVQSGMSCCNTSDVTTRAADVSADSQPRPNLGSCLWVIVRVTYINGGLGVLQDTIVQNKKTLQRKQAQTQCVGKITGRALGHWL